MDPTLDILQHLENATNQGIQIGILQARLATPAVSLKPEQTRMASTVTVQLIRKSLDERIPQAREEAANSAKVAMNSYGAGYDRGYLDALEEILKIANGETE